MSTPAIPFRRRGPSRRWTALPSAPALPPWIAVSWPAAPPPWRSLVVGWEGDADADAAAAVELLAACLRFDPAQRPTAAEALRFAFFASE